MLTSRQASTKDQGVSELITEIERSFNNENERSEPLIHAERILNVYDFNRFFEGRCAPIEGVTRVGCFGILKCKVTGRTILRSKECSHHENWEDDGTVTMFHVCIDVLFLLKHSHVPTVAHSVPTCVFSDFFYFVCVTLLFGSVIAFRIPFKTIQSASSFV